MCAYYFSSREAILIMVTHQKRYVPKLQRSSLPLWFNMKENRKGGESLRKNE